MPIRFRCEHCKQLLGIARRKAGSHVNCPTCQRQVLVPAQDEELVGQGNSPSPPGGNPLPAPAPAPFERDDFDALLRPPPSISPDAPRKNGGALLGPLSAPVGSNRPAGAGAAPVPSWITPPEPAGLVLSPARATLLTVGVILMLAVAFGGGLLVGRFWL